VPEPVQTDGTETGRRAAPLVSVSDSSAERVLLVEGDSDVEVLRAWFGQKLASHGIAIVPVHGGDKAWHTETVIRVLEQADTLQRKAVFLRARGDARGSSKGQCDIVNAYSNLATEPTSSSPVRAGHALPLQSELATREPCRERLCFEQKEPRFGGLRTCLPVVLSSSQAATPGHEQ